MNSSLLNLVLLAILVQIVSAFEETRPMLAWSSGLINLPESVYTLDKSSLSKSFLRKIPCSTMLVIDWPGLHSSDIKQYESSLPNLKEAMSKSTDAFNVPFFAPQEDVGDMTEHVTEEIKLLCGQHAVGVYPWNMVVRQPGVAPILTIRLPNTQASVAQDRADALSRDDTILKSALDALKKEAPDGNYIVILTSSSDLTSNLFKRAPSTSKNILDIPFSKRTIFQKYVFFNAPIFMGITSMIVLLAISLVAINMLASLQTPTKFENPQKKDK